jgi:Fe-S-cluster containining protein
LAAGEADAIASQLGMTIDTFTERFTRLTADRLGLSLIEKPDGSCIFLEGVATCRIQPAKPVQCVGFPNAWNFPGFEKQCQSKVNHE